MIGGISIWQLLILLAIVVMLFGTKRLRNLGGDLGTAIKGFRSAMNENEQTEDKEPAQLPHNRKDTIDGSSVEAREHDRS